MISLALQTFHLALPVRDHRKRKLEPCVTTERPWLEHRIVKGHARKTKAPAHYSMKHLFCNRPGQLLSPSLCLFPSLSLSLSLSLCLYLSVFLSLFSPSLCAVGEGSCAPAGWCWVWLWPWLLWHECALSLFMCICLSTSLCLFLSLSGPLSLFPSLSLSVSLSLALSLSLSLSRSREGPVALWFLGIWDYWNPSIVASRQVQTTALPLRGSTSLRSQKLGMLRISSSIRTSVRRKRSRLDRNLPRPLHWDVDQRQGRSVEVRK